MYEATDKRWLSAKAATALTALNTGVYAADFISGRRLSGLGNLSVAAVCKGGEYYRVLTAAFLHADIRHLFGNMLLLLYIGAVVERNTGSLLLLLLYILSAVCGNLATVGYELLFSEQWTSLGASGAVFGILGGMLVLVIRGRKYVKNSGSSLLRRLGFVIVYSLFTGVFSAGINNIAHVAGFLTGLLFTAAVTRGKKEIYLEALL